jgi:hypothetical protein
LGCDQPWTCAGLWITDATDVTGLLIAGISAPQCAPIVVCRSATAGRRPAANPEDFTFAMGGAGAPRSRDYLRLTRGFVFEWSLDRFSLSCDTSIKWLPESDAGQNRAGLLYEFRFGILNVRKGQKHILPEEEYRARSQARLRLPKLPTQYGQPRRATSDTPHDKNRTDDDP